MRKPTAADPNRMRHWLASRYPVPIDGEIIGVGHVVVDIIERKEAFLLREIRPVTQGGLASE